MAIDNILTGAALDEAYNKYLASYRNREKLLKQEYGLSMWDTKYSKVEFQNMYSAMANDLMADKGWKSVSDKVVIRNLIERQATELSEKQAKAFQRGMAKAGKYMTLAEVYKLAPGQMFEMNEQLKE